METKKYSQQIGKWLMVALIVIILVGSLIQCGQRSGRVVDSIFDSAD